ncbi:hypothetical protein NVP1213O_16 [Vibrio phage 1.213.O._10N.222.54.F10]|nr:hypothetical protein NVP1213O_16 [Vibrio phage 1.213.O._10N.222.54.F10]
MKYMQINVSYRYERDVDKREITMSIGIVANPELIGDDDIIRKVKDYIKDNLCHPSSGMIFIGISELELRIILCGKQPVFSIE